MSPTSDHAPAQFPAAGDRLRAAATGVLPRMPWQHPAEPPEATTLLRFALWRAGEDTGHASSEELADALSQIETARSDLEALESALLLTARAEGMTWGDIAQALGLRSPQAAQQRYQRSSSRPAPETATDRAPEAGPA